MIGGPGIVAGVPTTNDGGPMPIAVSARTENSYGVPLVRLGTSIVVVGAVTSSEYEKPTPVTRYVSIADPPDVKGPSHESAIDRLPRDAASMRTGPGRVA